MGFNSILTPPRHNLEYLVGILNFAAQFLALGVLHLCTLVDASSSPISRYRYLLVPLDGKSGVVLWLFCLAGPFQVDIFVKRDKASLPAWVLFFQIH